MALRHIFHHESVFGKQFFRSLRDFLSVLQRTRRVIRDHDVARLLRWLQRNADDIFTDVHSQRRYFRGGHGEIAVFAQHVAIILDHRAATGCCHQDGIQAVLLGFFEPNCDVGPRPRQRVLVVSEVMGQRPAALFILYQHHLDAVARQQVDRGLIDPGRQHLLRTALQQGGSHTLVQATKDCPHCAEPILAKARKCKHCGSDLG